MGLVALVCPETALAQETRVVLPASTLDRALTTLARTAGVDIISTEAGLRGVASRPISGRMNIGQALDRLLAGTGYHAVPASGGYRVVRDAVRPAEPKPQALRTLAPPPQLAPVDVVVTASKQRVPLLRYPGSLTLVEGTPRLPGGATGELSDLARVLPAIQSTHLGPGRNKVFIRGIADSSFNGTTQSTASVYLDDVQLNASGPDPGLRLYDMRSVEVMQGPQGSLYGVGSIGGVLRLTANPPETGRTAASAGGGVTATQAGAIGYDLNGMVNLPAAGDAVTVRGVGYAVRDGGYTDDAGRGVIDTNRTDTIGARLALLVRPGDGWRVETSGVAQQIRSRDGQYAQRGLPPVTRVSTIAQPFGGDFLFARLLVGKDWRSGLKLISTVGIAGYDTADLFDAAQLGGSTAAGQGLVYHADTDKQLVSHETRLSRSLPSGASWLAGITLTSDRSILSRSVGAPGQEADIVGVRNRTQAASAFGEATLAVVPALAVTLGGRYTVARIDSEPSSLPRGGAYIKGQTAHRFNPTVALSYRIAGDLAGFARYQTGFRTGGLAVARGIGRVANYRPDSIRYAEVGLRKLRRGATGVSLTVSGSAARWTEIQADLLTRRGQPYTTNLGDARLEAVEGVADWKPIPRLKLAGSFLYTHNLVSGAVADQSRPDHRRLPETPALSGYADILYAWPEGKPVTPRLGATLTYAGRSVLGVGDLLDVDQGQYVLSSFTAGARWRNLDLTLGVDNLANRTGNRFAFGNPFGLAARDQTTPLRPRSVRLGLAAAW